MNIERHISNLKQYIKDDEIIEKDGSDFANFCKGHIDDIQAVLNELERYKQLINKKNGRLNEYAEDIAKRDKVIDEMAKMINNHDVDEDICKQMGKKKDCNDYIMFEENCIDCIKEYFYKKVE